MSKKKKVIPQQTVIPQTEIRTIRDKDCICNCKTTNTPTINSNHSTKSSIEGRAPFDARSILGGTPKRVYKETVEEDAARRTNPNTLRPQRRV